jgi:hypothetical protein
LKESPFDDFEELFWSAQNNDIILSNLSKNKTYIFELTSPHNRVVVPYSETKITHIGTRNNINLLEERVDIGVKKPKEYSFEDLDKLVLQAKTLPARKEGYVVTDNVFNRVKVKSLEYLKMASLKNNGVITDKNVLQMILDGDYNEFTSYFPKYSSRTKRVLAKYESFLKQLKKDLKIAEEKKKIDRKKYADWAKNQKSPSILFDFYDGKFSRKNYKKYIENLNINYLKKLLEI